jgi:aryl-alcohol dehydrogenase-like predicted oxidoreductase
MDVSLVGLGCNNFGSRCDEQQSAAVVHAALDAGINLLDTADSYGGGLSEQYLGRALGRRRDEVMIATKFGSPHAEGGGGAHPTYVAQACAGSLRRLGTDYIDLYQLHFPDPKVPIADTLGALDALVQDGKVRAIGCSNFSSAQLQEAEDAAGAGGSTRFTTVQNELSLLQRRPERNVLPLCTTLGLGFLPYFPLASGLLTGKYRRGAPVPAGTRLASAPDERRAAALSDERLDAVEALTKLAEASGHSLLELSFSWLATRPAIMSIIAGATRPEQVLANASAVSWKLTPEELAAIDAIVPVAPAG